MISIEFSILYILSMYVRTYLHIFFITHFLPDTYFLTQRSLKYFWQCLVAIFIINIISVPILFDRQKSVSCQRLLIVSVLIF